jgi:hypothetical protein
VRYAGRVKVTVELDDDVASALRDAGCRDAAGLSEVVNATLRASLREPGGEQPPPLLMPSWSLGAKVNLDAVWHVLEEMDGPGYPDAR